MDNSSVGESSPPPLYCPPPPAPSDPPPRPKLSFKNAKSRNSKKSRGQKTLKQILALETRHRMSQSSSSRFPSALLYSEMEAGPSFRPAKRYSDISGFESRYSDPSSGLRFDSPDEYARIRLLPADVIEGLLEWRNAGRSKTTD